MVVILDVIEHVVAAEYLLAEISRVLKTGGFLITKSLVSTNFANIQKPVKDAKMLIIHVRSKDYRCLTTIPL